MLKLDISHDIAEVKRALELSERQARFAAAKAMTTTVVQARDAVYQEMGQVFEDPTPYTMRSLRVQSASMDEAGRQKLDASGRGRAGDRGVMEAALYVKGWDDVGPGAIPAEAYLRAQVDGITRRLKRFEKALQSRSLMPAGWQAVPATGPDSAARLDAFGNVSSGQIIQILSQLRVTMTAGHTRNLVSILGSDDDRTKRRKLSQQRLAYGRAGGQFISVPQQRGRLAPGIYLVEGKYFGARVGYGRNGRIKPVFRFVRSTSYQPRLDFYGVAARILNERLRPNFNAAWQQAMATAQPRGQGRLL